MKSELVGPDGKPVQSDRFSPCPKCSAGSDKRVPSSGFGIPYLICTKCGYEFKELTCPVAIS
jgi:ribosomal protein L37AE/L43A